MDGQFGRCSVAFKAGYNHIAPSGLMVGFESRFSFPDRMHSNLPIAFSGPGPSGVVEDNIEIFGAFARAALAMPSAIFGSSTAAAGFAYDRDLATSTDSFGNVDSVYFWRPGWTAAVARKSA